MNKSLLAVLGAVILAILAWPAFHCESPRTAIQADLNNLWVALTEYHRVYAAYPEGGDREILAALQGSNPDKIVFIEAQPKQLSPEGVLLDPWGTPFHFDFKADRTIKILSAGPDRAFSTPDDRFLGKIPSL